MDSNELVSKVARLHSSQSATIRFAKDGLSALQRLWGTRKHSAVTFRDQDEMVVTVIVQSNDWGFDQNRTLTVWGLSSVNEDLLAHMARDIESIDVADHLAKTCASKRAKVRSSAICNFQHKVLEPGIRAEAAEWGFSLGSTVIEQDGLPIFLFRIVNEGAILRTIAVDCWSGNVFTNWMEDCSVKPEADFHIGAYEANGLILVGLSSALEEAAEALTATA